MPPEYIRQSGIINIEEFANNGITIVGCGAIGSFVAVSLAKMGLNKFVLYDFDKVEPHNLPNQFFDIYDIGNLKVYATRIKMAEFNPNCSVKKLGRYTRGKLNTPIVISCVDDMNARKKIFESCVKDNKVQLFIDCRMGGLQGQVYTVDVSNTRKGRASIKKYSGSLFSNEEAVEVRCTERSIIFTVLGIASLVCNQIIKCFKEEEIKNYIVLDYSLPQMF